MRSRRVFPLLLLAAAAIAAAAAGGGLAEAADDLAAAPSPTKSLAQTKAASDAAAADAADAADAAGAADAADAAGAADAADAADAAAADAASADAADAAAASEALAVAEAPLGVEGLLSSLVPLGVNRKMADTAKAAAERLQLLAREAQAALDELQRQQTSEGRESSLQGKEALDLELGSYKTAMSLYSGCLTHMRQRLVNEAAALQRLGDHFVTKASTALSIINNQYRPFEEKLQALEATMEGLLAPGTGRVSGMLVEFRKQLQEAAAGELEGIAAKVEEVVSQLRSANGQLDELLQHSEEARTLAANEVSNAEDRMMDTLRLFDLLTRQELLQLAQQQQQCAQKEIESFQVKLDGMHLHEHVLETLVDKFASDLEDYRERRRVSRLLTFMDLSAAFAGPRPQSVCSVLMHLVRQKPAARDVAVVFVYGVDPPKASGLDMNAPLAVPSPQVLRAAAASWKARTEVYGHRATSYAVVRVEGLLLEVFTVPFLEGERIGFAADDELRAAEPAEFAAKLAEAVNEANLTSGSEAPFSLVVYLGQLKEDRVRPPPTRDLSHNRTLYVRHMVQHLKPATRSLAAVWERLRAQLQFIDAAAAALKEGSSNGEAVQLSVRRLDVEIICFSAPVPPPPCRRDPHLREALHYLQIRLLPISGGFVVPDEAVLTAALTSLVRMVHGGGPSCPLVVTTTQKKKKHFWQRPTYSASIDLRTTDLSKRSGSEKGGGGGAAGGGDTEDEAPVAASKGAAAAAGAPPSLAPSPSALGGTAAVSLGPLEGAPGGTPSLTKGAEEGRHEEGAHPELYDLRSSRAESYRDSLHAAEKGGLWDRRGEGPRTAREVKGITLRDAVAGLAKAAESVVLLSEPWTRGYTLYIHVCIIGSSC